MGGFQESIRRFVGMFLDGKKKRILRTYMIYSVKKILLCLTNFDINLGLVENYVLG